MNDKKHDDNIEDNFEDAEEIPDYNIRKSANPTLFVEFIGNTVNDELEYCLKRDVICTIAVVIEQDNEKRLIGLWADFNRQVIEETNVSFKNIF